MEELNEVIVSFLIAVITGVIGLISSYFALYMKRISDKLKSEIEKEASEEQKKLIEQGIERINTLVYNSVYSAQKTIVQVIKNASEDGKLTVEDGKMIKETVKEDILKQISIDLEMTVKSEIDDIEAYVMNQIEIQLDKVKEELVK